MPAKSAAGLEKLGKRLVFLVFTPQRGYELWASDGTAKRTAPISDIVPGPGSANPGVPLWVSDGEPSELIRAGNRVFFPGYDRGSGVELWAVEP